MRENYIKLSQNLVFLVAILSTFVSTLFFLPTTSEFFEFNKFTAILTLTIIGLLAWAARMVLEKRFGFTKTPLDVPILILIAVFFVATLSSLDQVSSFVGAHGRLWPAFFPLATVGTLYFLITSNLKTKRQVELLLWSLVGGTSIASVISALSYFGIYMPFDFAQTRSFNTLGIINRLAQLQAFVLPITIYWAIFAANKNIRIVATILTIIVLFSFVLISSLPAYIMLAAGLLFLAVGNMKSKLARSAQSSIILLATVAVIFLIIRFVPQVAQGTLASWINTPDGQEAQVDMPKELKLTNRTSWDIASQAIGKRPLFGTGPGTFQFAYTQLKPRYMNAQDQWSVRFDKPASDFTEIITTVGIFGALAYLLFAIVVLRFIWSLIFKGADNPLYLPISASIIAALVGNFVTVSSLATVVPVFLALASLSILAKITNENYVYDVTVELATLKGKFSWFPIGTSNDLIKTTAEGKGAKSQILPMLFLIAVFAASVLALRYQLNAYTAEYNYRQALLAARSNDGNKTVAFLQNALRSNPRIDTYHRILSNTSLNAALNLSNRGNLTEEQQRLLLQLSQVAIDQGKVASGYQILPLKLPGISAANVANWESLAAVYQAMIGAITGADVHAVNTLSQAVSLDPQNPILHDRLGLLYQRVGNKDLAQRKFEDAAIVKGDYGPAHYHLAKILIENKGEVARIVAELNAAKRLLPENDPAIADIDANLATYNQQLQDLQAQNQKAPEASPSPGASPSPSPSPSPKTSPKTSPSPSPTL